MAAASLTREFAKLIAHVGKFDKAGNKSECLERLC